ncbi:hypothetical protein H6F87_24975 [Cyanobacteria bacterium FACHB-502]|nr:hypothetical protein [Cyanobacteria bacterium FACHB-502]
MGTEYIANGLNGATGSYLIPTVSAKQISQVAREVHLDPDHLFDLEMKLDRAESDKGITRGKDPTKLEESGWGVIFATKYKDEEATGLTAEAIKDALSPLLNRRKAQATQQNEKYYREFFGRRGPDRAFHPDDSKQHFLYKNKIASSVGVADPDNLPYYLLIVGDPETIPFSFQYELDVEYAVGRLYFDSWDQYRRYAETVVAVETGKQNSSRRATFFGVRNQDDQATRSSADYLIPPLVKHLNEIGKPGWNIDAVLGESADKKQLKTLLGGAATPDFLFTASHGIAFPKDHELHRKHQGALVCQDWPGPQEWGEKPIPTDHYFSVDDISDDTQLKGLIAFHFACYGAGMPKYDNFYRQSNAAAAELADREFVAQLPQALLSHVNGGAMAVIGHIDRTWTRSFQSELELPRLGVFQSTLSSILDGEPIGLAMEYFNQRYGVCATDLHQALDRKEADGELLASTWLDTNDARNYIILGDPAVQLGSRFAPGDATKAVREQSTISLPSEQITQPAATSLATADDDLRATVTRIIERLTLLEQQVQQLQQENQNLRAQILQQPPN